MYLKSAWSGKGSSGQCEECSCQTQATLSTATFLFSRARLTEASTLHVERVLRGIEHLVVVLLTYESVSSGRLLQSSLFSRQASFLLLIVLCLYGSSTAISCSSVGLSGRWEASLIHFG